MKGAGKNKQEKRNTERGGRMEYGDKMELFETL